MYPVSGLVCYCITSLYIKYKRYPMDKKTMIYYLLEVLAIGEPNSSVLQTRILQAAFALLPRKDRPVYESFRV
ncbi:MAG: hypothetical protein NVSMB49_08260 [Ktedonobacteraceae bacterium]